MLSGHRPLHAPGLHHPFFLYASQARTATSALRPAGTLPRWATHSGTTVIVAPGNRGLCGTAPPVPLYRDAFTLATPRLPRCAA